MDVGQNSPEVEVFEENIPNVHCRTSIALGELQLGGFQMGAGGCWAPLQWEVVLGGERLLGPNLASTPERVNTYILNAKQLAEFTFQVKNWRKKYVNRDNNFL